MKCSLEGFDAKYATMPAAPSAAKAKPVAFAAGHQVEAPADGRDFHGVAANVRGGYALVQLTGAVTLPYTGSAPAVGYQNLAADGKGGVKVLGSARSRLVTEVDEGAGTVTILL